MKVLWTLLMCWVLVSFVAACDPAAREEPICSNDSDCGQFERCIEQLCVSIECQHSGDCPSGQDCVDNFCVESSVCQSDADCEEPTPICDPGSGSCVACAPECTGLCCGDDGCGGTCADECDATGQTCDTGSCTCEGTCVPNCQGKLCGPDGCGEDCQPGCSADEVCDGNGQCQPLGCQSDADCQVPTPRCNTGTGICVVCLGDADCTSPQTCSGGMCVDPAVCVSSDQCEIGQICFDGDCLPGCGSDRDCPGDETCREDLGAHGQCVACEQPGDCGDGQTCENYNCVPHCTSDSHCTPLYCDQASHDCVDCTADAHCAQGEICQGFACVVGCRADGDCASGHCNTSSFTCVECVTTDDCALGSLCIGELCVQGCEGDRDCPGTLVCDPALGDHGTCVECLLDSDCDPAYRCVVGLCQFYCGSDADCAVPNPACDLGNGVCVECTNKDDCAVGNLCISQACVPGCVEDRDCPEPLVCDPGLGDHGGCVECLSDADCYTGFSCENNLCIIEGSDMVRLPGGGFMRGSNSGDVDETPVETILVPTYYLDRTEVTNDQYRACLQAGPCSPPSDATDFNDSLKGTHPVRFVTWDQAVAFCGWMGKSLPSEARWERAAKGTGDQVYPWGNGAPDCSRANYAGCAGSPLPVGTRPNGASPEGVLDMAGNVYEWVHDRYAETYYADSSVMTDPYGPLDGEYRVIRGGGYDSPASNIRAANRSYADPALGHTDVGFRCSLRGSPTAGFSVQPASGPYATTTFAVDASSSTDPNQPIDALEVRWDWEADDTYDTIWTTAKAASHRYAFNGIFRIRMEVRDPDGNTDTASTEVVAEGTDGWDGVLCETHQDCAHGFSCVLTNIFTNTYHCREDCIWLLDEQCHIPGRTCQFALDPLGNACLPE